MELADCPLLRDAETGAFFDLWRDHGCASLQEVSLRKCHELKGLALDGLLAVAPRVEVLDLAGWKDLEEDKVGSLAKRTQGSLTELDVGWCSESPLFGSASSDLSSRRAG